MQGDDKTVVGEAFLDGVWSDLQAFGGIKPVRFDPLRRSKEFAKSVFDAAAVLLARRYQNGIYDYEMADWIANAIDGEMLRLMIEIQSEQEPIEIPQDWSEVYEAFDSGEFDHFGRSKNPVREFTDPGIKAFLERKERNT